MAYEPLHHKYRPQRFADVVGQTAVVRTLANAIRLGRIAPAYLFCGPRGTGKTSSARILAKSLNCEQGPTSDPCLVCNQCRAITQGSALDVIEIDAASNTGVDNIRELIERAQFAPVSGRYKIYIIDECHMLSTAAFNALLKTLEEPPERVIFVLATTDPQRVLPTVISRCQRFDYRRIPLEAMVEHLRHIAQQERIPILPEALELIAQLSQGGLRDAESLLDQLSLLEGEITLDAVWDMVGAVPERQLLQLTDAIQAGEVDQVLTLTRQLLDHGKEPLILLQNLVGFYRDFLLANTAPDRQDLVALTQDTWAALRARASTYSAASLLQAQTHLRQAEPQIRQTHQPRLWLEITLLDLVQKWQQPTQPLPSPTPPASVPSTPAGSSPPCSTPPPTSHGSLPPSPVTLAPTPAEVPPPATVAPIPAESATLESLWQEFLGQIKHPLTKALIQMGFVAAETPTEVTLGFPKGFAEKAQSKASEIKPLIQDLLGRSVQLKFMVQIPPKPSSSPSSSGHSPAPPVSTRPTASDPSLSPHSDPSPPLPTPSTNPHTSVVEISPAAQTAHHAVMDLDELEQAAKRFASFFNGVMIDPEENDLLALDRPLEPQDPGEDLNLSPEPERLVPMDAPTPAPPEAEEEEIPF